jgi:hypothetical protein
MRDPVCQACRYGVTTDENLAGKEITSGAVEAIASARSNVLDEVVVDRRLESLEADHILLPFRPEGVEHRLVVARRVDPSLDTQPLESAMKAEAGRDYADRPRDRGRVDPNLVCGSGQPVAPGSGYIFHEGMDRNVMSIRETTDMGADERRLNG